MDVVKEFNVFIHNFSVKPKDELAAWGCIGLGAAIFLIGLLII